jgi:hypothetical protein
MEASGSVQIMADTEPGGQKTYGFGFTTLNFNAINLNLTA